jgi:hypothetical protein
MEKDVGNPTLVLKNSDMPVTFVEGFSQLQVGFPNSRVLLHSFTEKEMVGDKLTENRIVAVHLMMPTVQLMEMCQQILNAFATHKDQFSGYVAEVSRRNQSVIDAAQPVPFQKFPPIV